MKLLNAEFGQDILDPEGSDIHVYIFMYCLQQKDEPKLSLRRKL